jgi:hypothetical protein
MDTFEKSLKLIDKYFAENNRHIVEEELNKYDSISFEGVTFDEYLAGFSKHFTFNEFNPGDASPDFFATISADNNPLCSKIELTFESITGITFDNFSSNIQQEYTGNRNLPEAA